jgi:hypothetical protein
MQGEINHMSPAEIGHAAAYEAYRTWLRDSAMYEIVGERERQREGLVGIAVAEGLDHPVHLAFGSSSRSYSLTSVFSSDG